MDDKLQIVRHLYGEDNASSDRDRLLADETLRTEYEILSGVKFHLDQRPKQRPDVAVLDHVFAAAAAASGQPALRPRQDRNPQPRNATRRMGLLSTVSAMVAVLIVAGIGFYQMQQDGLMQTEPAEPAVSEAVGALADQAAPLAEEKESRPIAADEPSPVASVASAKPGENENRLDRVASAPMGRAMAEPAPPMEMQAEASGLALDKTEADGLLADDADESVPAWDASDEVLRMHRQLEMVETRSPEFAWGDSVVMSLDVLPTNPGARDTVTPVSTRRGNH